MTTEVQGDKLGEQLSWFRDIIELQNESTDASEFMDTITQDFFTDKVYVFTPNGDVMELPEGGSTLDFAYHVHSEVGDRSAGAKVNGKIVPLNYKLKTGDIVEIITSPSASGPSRDWLNFVRTSKARNKIRRYFRDQDHDSAVESGQKVVIQLIKDQDFEPKDFMKNQIENKVAENFHFRDAESLYAAIGFNEIRPLTVVNKFTEAARKERKEKEQASNITAETIEKKTDVEKMKIRHEDGVVVEDTENLLLRLSKCCNPVPGDEIVGYITRGRGVSVHRKDCPNVENDIKMKERLIEVEWENTHSDKIYDTELEIYGFDRSGLLNDILEVINSLTSRLSNVNGRVDNDEMATIRLSIGISNTDELESIIDKLNQVPDVYSIRRIIL